MKLPKLSTAEIGIVLAAVYVGLAVYLLVAGLALYWAAVALLMAVIAALRWGAGRGYLAAAERGRLPATAVGMLWRVPAPFLGLPLPLAASWFAGERAIATTPTNYWVALGLWLGGVALFVALVVQWPRRLAWPNVREWRSLPWLELAAVGGLTLVALGARVVDLVDEPNPFSGDEANFAFQGLQAERGELRNMFATGWPFGQPSMYFFVVALSYKLFGVGVLAERLPSAILGSLTVPLLYLLLRDLFDRRVALVGSAFLAVYSLSIHFSRLGMNNLSASFVTVLALALLARGLRTENRLYFGLAGGAAGLSFYSYAGARVIPLVMAAWVLAAAVRDPRLMPRNLSNLVLLAVGFAVVAGPQALVYVDDPDQFYASARASSVFASGWLDREVEIRGQSAFEISLDQVRRGLGVLLFYGETSPHYNAREPLVDGISRVFFLIGGVWALSRLGQPRNVLLMALLLATLLGGGAFSVPPVSAARYVTAIPAIAAFVALGLVRPAELMTRWLPRIRSVAAAGVVGALSLLAFVNLQFYFGHYLPNDLYSGGPGDVNDAAGRYIGRLDSDYVAYLLVDPFWSRENVVAFFGREATMIDLPAKFQGVPPPPADKTRAAFLAAPHREEELRNIASRCPGGTWRSFWDEHDQRYLFYSYEVPGAGRCALALSGA